MLVNANSIRIEDNLCFTWSHLILYVLSTCHKIERIKETDEEYFVPFSELIYIDII